MDEDNNKKEIALIKNVNLSLICYPIIVGIILFIKSIFFYQNTITMNEQIDKITMIGTAFFICSFISIIFIVPKKRRFIATTVIDVLVSILLFSNNLYYSYSSSVLSVAQITNLQYTEEIAGTVPMLFQLKYVLYFIDLIPIILYYLKYYKKQIILNKSKKIYRIVEVVVFMMIIVICGKKEAVFIKKTKEEPYNKDMQVKKSTIYGYHIADIKNTMNIKKQAKYADKEKMLEEYNKLKENYNEKYNMTNYDFQGIAKDKNIIILQLESIQDFVIDKKINGQEIMPNLSGFLNDNIRFNNMYMQSYSSTADSEFSSITSLYPMENGMSYSKYYTNKYDDIFKIFKNNGYNTSYVHGNDGNFWNRGNVYQNFGVDNIELKDKFSDISENIMGYLSDELMYKQTIEKMKEYKYPFISYVVSASSHTGFTLDGLQDRSKVNIDVGKYKDTFFGNYLESVNYADYAFGKFIEELKEENLYNDTVILVYGDHNGLDMYNEELQDFLKATNQKLNDIDIKTNYIRVAGGIKIPGIKNLEIDKPISKLDIKPTLTYLIDSEDGISLGTNMFANKDFISLNNERIVTSKYYYDEKWFYRDDGTEVDMEKISEEERNLLKEYYDNMKKELDISVSISINNLLK